MAAPSVAVRESRGFRGSLMRTPPDGIDIVRILQQRMDFERRV